MWMVPNGDGPRNHPLIKDLNLPPLGNIGRPAALLTKTLLFVGDSSSAVMGRAGISGPAKFRAYDKASGSLVTQLDLPTGTTGGPMTFLAQGRQLIVVPVGGKGYGTGWMAFGLPVSANETGVYSAAQAKHGEQLTALAVPLVTGRLSTAVSTRQACRAGPSGGSGMGRRYGIFTAGSSARCPRLHREAWSLRMRSISRPTSCNPTACPREKRPSRIRTS